MNALLRALAPVSVCSGLKHSLAGFARKRHIKYLLQMPDRILARSGESCEK